MSEFNQSQVSPEVPAQAQEAAAAPAQITDLDGLSEFTFQGQKLTPEQLLSVLNEHKSLSEKQKSFAEQEKFDSNLDADIDLVLQDPTKAAKFKQIYPPKYHAYLDRLLATRQSEAPQQQAQAALPKEFMDEFGQIKQRLQFHEERAYQSEVQAASAKLDAMMPPLFEKFPLANEEQVYARAEALINGGTKLTDKTWERLVRESHESMQKKSDAHYAKKLKTQIENGQKGAGEGPGGATPGQAPVRRTFDQAREDAIKALNGR